MTLARETTLELTARPALTLSRLGLLLAVGASLSGCGLLEGSRLYHGPDSVIATDDDTGTDDGGLVDGEAAIAYDPDGCQVWIIDDGLEGYSSPRFDPKTGLPVCDSKYPPGTVIGDYQSSSSPIADRVPR
jgi:hypothetical protein